MCELLGISSLAPTTVGLTLERLARHGGSEGPHDGWGVAFYQDEDALVLREPGAAAESQLANYIEHHTPPSKLVISHIRHATQGKRALCNTQPFQRELAGRVHLFAHNGDLDGIEKRREFLPSRFYPIGQTDSELAFCALLSQLHQVWMRAAGRLPSLSSRLETVTEFARSARALGPANFLYSDGDALFVHGHLRKQGNAPAAPPGLYVMERDYDGFESELSGTGVIMQPAVQQRATLVASVPLGDGDWRPLHEGEILAIQNGVQVAATMPLNR
jgi:predicted glutamine amidotransferase